MAKKAKFAKQPIDLNRIENETTTECHHRKQGVTIMPTKKNPTKPATRKSAKKAPAPTEGLVLVYYSTPGNSWISAYANAEVAKTRVIENARVHFAGQWDDGEVTEHANDIRLKIDQKEPVIEFGDWSAEINYNENVYTV